jgi:CAAX protease family protein
MSRGFLKEASTGSMLLYTLLIVVASWIVFQFISLFAGIWIFNVDFETALSSINHLEDPKIIAYLKFVQSITSVGMFIVSSWVVAWSLSTDPIKFMGLDFWPGFFMTFLVIILTLFTLPMNNYLTYFNNQLELPKALSGLQEYFVSKEAQMENVMNGFLSVQTFWGLLMNIIIIGLIPAVGEEFLFRGLIQKFLVKGLKRVHLAVLLTAFVFALFHFQFLSILPRFVLGIILGYLYIWSGSLWMPILMHFINNSLAVVYFHFYLSGKTGDTLEVIGTPGNDLVYALLSIVIVTIILFVIRRISLENASLRSAERL